MYFIKVVQFLTDGLLTHGLLLLAATAGRD